MPEDRHLPWTDEQWATMQRIVHESARKARVASSFLPLIGLLLLSSPSAAQDRDAKVRKNADVVVDDLGARGAGRQARRPHRVR